MTWIGLLLAAVAATDLARATTPRSWPHWGAGVVTLLGLTLLVGIRGASALACLLVVAVLVVAWDRCVRLADERPGAGAAAPALLLLGLALVAGVLLAPWSDPAGGAWADWLARAPWPGLAALDPDRALLLLGVVLVQLSTGNVVVRLVLQVTVEPSRPGRPGETGDPSQQLRGGRLLGPMERLVILGLGLAGQLTAATIVIAAKGLLRWPELQAGRQDRAEAWDVHRVTEYFLVGSFVSWLVALGGLVLTR